MRKYMLKMKLVLELDENFSTWKLHGFAWGKCIRQCFMMIMVWGFTQVKPEEVVMWLLLLMGTFTACFISYGQSYCFISYGHS